MKIRKIAYTIGFVHILTFKDLYKPIFAPFFDYMGLEYAIEYENTLNESIKLVYKNSGIIMQFNKEMASLVYEGDVSDVKKQNAVIEIFFEIVEKIKKAMNFVKIANHRIELNCVDILEKEKVQELLDKNSFIRNPFGKLKQFATVFEFTKDNKEFRLQFGNFEEHDKIKFNLSPLNTAYNKELDGNVGIIGILTFLEITNSSNFSKFKALIKEGEETLEKYLN